jgi:DNA polymerase/3'-5' exonuclease PolX/histidinol phosphatase-like PHP family hydrolase
MTKNEIADVLTQIGTLLELKGENPFKTRAYQAGARVIESMESAAFERLLADDNLKSVKGIGDALAQKIGELHATGRLEFFEKLKASIEPGLVEMLDVPGLGPKKIKALHDQLGIATMADLTAACTDGRVAALAGFGEKSQEKILAGIRNREAYGKRHHWWLAQAVAAPIVAGLRALPQVSRAEAAGSLRRGMETVGDLDFIVAATEIAPVVEWFVTQPGVKEITARGETKASVRFESGLQADLRLVPAEQFAFALHHFTGSKDHNVQMRQRALARGWSLSEWGLVPAEQRRTEGGGQKTDFLTAKGHEGTRRAENSEQTEPRGGEGAAEQAMPRSVSAGDEVRQHEDGRTESSARNAVKGDGVGCPCSGQTTEQTESGRPMGGRGNKTEDRGHSTEAEDRGRGGSETGDLKPESGGSDSSGPASQVPAISETQVSGLTFQISSEEALFAALDLRFIPPELREGLGEIEAAEAGPLSRLVELGDLHGAFHNHTTASDGVNTLSEMTAAAEALGWDYLGIADHSKSSVQAKGLTEERLAAQVAEIRALNASGRFKTHVFAGTECDILPDGRLDFDDAVLASLDYVVVSVHSAFTQSIEDMTARIIRAIEHPRTTMLGHITGRLLLRREAYQVDFARIIDAAIAHGVVIELNASPWRLDMDWRHWRKAAERGLLCAINPDAHDTEGLGHVAAGINSARKGWLTREHVLNTRSLSDVRTAFEAKQKSVG